LGLMSFIDAAILNWKDRKYINRRNRIMSEIEQEVDPQKRFEKLIILKILGTLLGGMASSTAFMSFKQEHFDTLDDSSEQDKLKSILLQILRSNEYLLPDKMKVAYVCADIVLVEAIPEIEKMLQYTKKDSYEDKILNQSLQALKTEKSITELIYDELRQKGDL
jgi:hypothetical protein